MPESDLDLLIAAAREAGQIATRYWEGDNTVWDKGRDDPVSQADYAVDAYLHEALLGARPGYGWLSEETEDTPERASRDRVFVVDPIDGTRAFVAGRETWAHSLAVSENGRVTAAVVYLPLKDKLYAATLGGGAYLNAAAIHAARADTLSGASVLIAKPALDPKYWDGNAPQIARHFRPSLAYRLALVAEGRFDAMLTLRDSWEWDIAAGALIATEAGATVSDRTGADLRFNSKSAKTAGVVVATPAIHRELIARLRP